MNNLRKVLIISTLIICSLSEKRSHYMTKDLEINEIQEYELDLYLSLNGTLMVGSFEDALNTTGWSFLQIKTNGANSDYQQMYSAGYYEGYNTYYLIWCAWNNYNAFQLNMEGTISSGAQEYVTNQTNWILETAAQNIEDDFWYLVNCTMSQLFGMYDGYQAALQQYGLSEYNLTFNQFYYLANMGDLEDIIPGFNSAAIVNQTKDCTGFIRLTEDDLYLAHNTHNAYPLMLRVFKDFFFDLNNPLVHSKSMIFSSRPGDMESKDDFYYFNTNLGVIETSFNTYNQSNYGFFHYDSLPCWLRVIVANRLAKNGEEWANYFFTNRSGTHNNQWVFIDFVAYKNQKKNIANATNIVWLIEEYYYLQSEIDVTQLLLIPQGYVGSYNMPYNQTIYNVSDYAQNWGYNYTTDPRAVLLSNMGPATQSVPDIQYLMRFENVSTYQTVCYSIAPRCDLLAENPYLFGAIDAKVMSSEMLARMTAFIVSSPTTEGLPAFSWDNWESSPHAGMPAVFDFDWLPYISPFHIIPDLGTIDA